MGPSNLTTRDSPADPLRADASVDIRTRREALAYSRSAFSYP